MAEKDIAIKIEGLKKRYRLGTIGGGTLRGDIESWWALKRGKEDPNSKVDAKVHSKNEVFYAINGMDLTIYKGERIGIIGHNGAGKSTLLKLISRVTAPTEGRICIDGRIASMLEVGMGFNAELTGRENIYINGAILGMTKAEVDAKIEQIIDFSEVRQFIDTPVKRYSSGMYVKLAFAVAAHLDSEIMIMDEVLAVGDMAFQKKCLDKMNEVSKDEGRTVLYVSHNMNTIRQLCERCIVLSKGQIIFNGSTEDAISLYLSSNKNEEVAIDFSKRKLPQWLTAPKILLKYFEFVDKKNNIYADNEKVKIKLQWNNTCDINDLCLRFEILNYLNEAVTTYCLYDFMNCKKGINNELVTELDINNLVEADYQIKVCFFEKDRFGNNLDIGFGKDIYFKKEIKSKENALIWNPRSWGFVKQPSPEICSIK